MYRELRNAYKILVGSLEGKRPLERPKLRWEDDIKLDLREIGLAGVDWIDLAEDRNWWWTVVKTVMNLWLP
jgi:hypothetical protein